MKIAFNLKQDEITLKIHNQEKVCKGMLFSDEFSPKIVFSKSYHIIDVSEIAVDKLVVNAEHTYTFPLDEADGESVCKRTSASMEALGIPLYMGVSGMGAVITAFSPLSTASISFFRAYVRRTVSFT